MLSSVGGAQPNRPARVRVGRFLIGLLTVTLAVTGCTKARTPDRSTPVASTTPSISATSPVPSNNTSGATNLPTAVSPTSAGSSTPQSSSRPTTAAPPTTAGPTAPTGPPACATSQLTVGVQRLSGAAGHQYAQIQFRNSSTATCSLFGFPGVTLLHGTAALGRPASRSSVKPTTVTLKPSGRAGALLTDASTCNADLSDGVQVIVPNRTETVRLALSLRGCALTIDPVVAG